MKSISISIFIILMLGCSSNEAETDRALLEAKAIKDSATSFPVKTLQILSKKEAGFGADIRLSYTKSSAGDRSVIYKVNSIYENENIGFELTVPTNEHSKLTFKSSGPNSDNFIRLLSKLYKQQIDTTQKFTYVTIADCVNMGEYLDSLNKETGENYITLNQYKLFLEGDKDGNYAELYLNINPNEHWIELGEKDVEYRPSVIALLSKK
jgi:hypothetical protein